MKRIKANKNAINKIMELSMGFDFKYYVFNILLKVY